MRYGFTDEKFYIHSTSRESHKIDAIRKNDRVCLTVVERHTMMPEKYTTDYRSAIAFGRARLIEDDEGKRKAMEKMMASLAPEYAKEAMAHCQNSTRGFVII